MRRVQVNVHRKAKLQALVIQSGRPVIDNLIRATLEEMGFKQESSRQLSVQPTSPVQKGTNRERYRKRRRTENC